MSALNAVHMMQRAQQLEAQSRQQLQLAPNQTVVFESRYQPPTMKFSTDGLSQITLTSLTSLIRMDDINLLSNELNEILANYYKVGEKYDRTYFILFVVLVISIFLTAGLSIVFIFCLFIIPKKKQQEMERVLEQEFKPQIRRVVQTMNQKIVSEQLEWIVAYVPFVKLAATTSAVEVAVVLRLIKTQQPLQTNVQQQPSHYYTGNPMQ